MHSSSSKLSNSPRHRHIHITTPSIMSKTTTSPSTTASIKPTTPRSMSSSTRGNINSQQGKLNQGSRLSMHSMTRPIAVTMLSLAC